MEKKFCLSFQGKDEMEEMENGIPTVEETSICIISSHNTTTEATTGTPGDSKALENKEKSTEKHNSAPSSSSLEL